MSVHTLEEARDKISLVMVGIAGASELAPVLKYLTELDESVKADVTKLLADDNDLRFVKRQAS